MATDDRWDDEPGQDRGRRGSRGGDSEAGHARLQTPGLMLMLFGLFSLFLGVTLLALYVAAPDVIARPYHNWLTDTLKGIPQRPGQPPPVPPYEDFKQQLMIQGGIGSLVSVLCSVVVALGGMRMRSATGRSLALAGSILAIIPCTTSCCILGMPIGIWAVAVVSSADAKAAFAANDGRRSRSPADDENEAWK